VVVPEGLLKWMQLTVLGKSFDGKYLASVSLNSQKRTGLDCAAVKQYGACAAIAGVASDVGTSQP
jgi:hypothetical protein